MLIPRRFFAALCLGGLLLASPANADMFQNAANASLPAALDNLGLGLAASPMFSRLGLLGGTPTDAALRIGTLATTPFPTPDPAMIFGRALVTSTNAHGITDASSFNGTGVDSAYNSYDARTSIIHTGSSSGSHYAGFQNRPELNNTAEVPNVIGYSDAGAELNTAFNVAKYYAFRANPPTINSTGKITQYFGTRYEEIFSSVATDVWPIYQEGNSLDNQQAYFGSRLCLGANKCGAQLGFGGARTTDKIIEDASVWNVGSTQTPVIMAGQINLNHATDGLTYWSHRPNFKTLQNNSGAHIALSVNAKAGDTTASAFNLTGRLVGISTTWSADTGYTGTISRGLALYIPDGAKASSTVTGQAGIAIVNQTAGTNNVGLLTGVAAAATVPTGNFQIYANGTDPSFFGNGSVFFSPATGVTATTSTGPFPYFPSMNGPPTGVPASATNGRTAIVVDHLNSKICWYQNASSVWKCATGS